MVWSSKNYSHRKDGVFSIPFSLTVPQATLSADATSVLVPDFLVVQNAYARALVERGEDGGLNSSEAYQLYRGMLADQIALEGTRYPEGRQGVSQGSIVTGRGVEALMGGFDTQVKTAQQVLAEALKQVFVAGSLRSAIELFDLGYDVIFNKEKIQFRKEVFLGGIEQLNVSLGLPFPIRNDAELARFSLPFVEGLFEFLFGSELCSKKRKPLLHLCL